MLEVLPARLTDGPEILELWTGAARWIQAKGINQWHPDEFNLAQTEQLIMDRELEFFVAKTDGIIIGTLYICWSDPVVWGELNDAASSGYIHRFAVKRSHLGQGVGRELLLWAEDYIRIKGKKQIRLDCMADNERLNQYYVTSGYIHKKLLHWDNGWKINLYEKE
ncbi:GNAT family N-acetyltransferase [Paenibacillus urinalis]|uniref:GNAT family N-acetyltransferase n=1 Tax=Paenibacillus urinalis TaxID=521520 RepID=A0ABY7XFP0_9BACL|nr:GNAT family N-acetyltransferase [Paenibacillus urinalis]WDH95447.1 GNAT family N-acetyltransferase [Paenibacillus urinalis]WDI03644.1 GNAT family N-acetyltransferase [Paenibacillus urinalis]